VKKEGEEESGNANIQLPFPVDNANGLLQLVHDDRYEHQRSGYGK